MIFQGRIPLVWGLSPILKRFVVFLVLASVAPACAAQWFIASATGRAVAGEPFEIVVLAPEGEEHPDTVAVRVADDPARRVLTMRATGPARQGRRIYEAIVPRGLSGGISLELADLGSNTLLLAVQPADALHSLVGASRSFAEEPPLSEYDPMYFVVGSRGVTNARFQISFKYRLFDTSGGYGREQPWLTGFYFGYTQTSLWDLESESKPFYDTSYKPAAFWQWERKDEKLWVDGLRTGLEHESNGGGTDRSRSINTAFVQPIWRIKVGERSRLEFLPKVYGYLDKDENPDIADYRGYVDWNLRYVAGSEWVSNATARWGRDNKGSLLVDVSYRIRDLRFGPLSSYLHFQYFNGYGESILDYDVRRKSQFRIGIAIVP